MKQKVDQPLFFGQPSDFKFLLVGFRKSDFAGWQGCDAIEFLDESNVAEAGATLQFSPGIQLVIIHPKFREILGTWMVTLAEITVPRQNIWVLEDVDLIKACLGRISRTELHQGEYRTMKRAVKKAAGPLPKRVDVAREHKGESKVVILEALHAVGYTDATMKTVHNLVYQVEHEKPAKPAPGPKHDGTQRAEKMEAPAVNVREFVKSVGKEVTGFGSAQAAVLEISDLAKVDTQPVAGTAPPPPAPQPAEDSKESPATAAKAGDVISQVSAWKEQRSLLLKNVREKIEEEKERFSQEARRHESLMADLEAAEQLLNETQGEPASRPAGLEAAPATEEAPLSHAATA